MVILYIIVLLNKIDLKVILQILVMIKNFQIINIF